METFIALQIALLPIQAILFLGTYYNWQRVQATYRKSLLRLAARTR